MKTLILEIRRREFEARIFISLVIVLVVCTSSYLIDGARTSNAILIGRLAGLSSEWSVSLGFLATALLLAVASLLRMWAGSLLTSDRVMAFRVQSDALMTGGPYAIVRNPIYLADLLAMCGFALCLPPTGLALPALMYVHYYQIVRFEEDSLLARFGTSYVEYARRIPRLIPGLKGLLRVNQLTRGFVVTQDGARHNALYLLFVVGLVAAAFTREFIHAVVIGLPGIYDWAVNHTRKGLPPAPRNADTIAGRKGRKKSVFDDVLYAQCWEDPQSDRAALRIASGDVVFCITSGGCNALTFLLDDPQKVIALDVNPHQTFMLELKIAAIRTLGRNECLEFLGVRESVRRREFYARLRPVLSEAARRYWDNQEKKILRGVIHTGRYEAYMRLLRTALRWMIGRDVLRQFFEIEDEESRREAYRKRWENLRWKLFTRMLLSRTAMTLLFDKAFFRYVDRSFSFGEHFARKTKHALTALPTRENYFLAYILLGRYYSERHLPVYLREENYDVIRGCIDRIEPVAESCGVFLKNLPGGSISKFNFSNIFEWMSPTEHAGILREAIRVGRDHAVVIYRNLLVFRERPAELAGVLRPHRNLARALLSHDLSFIYNNFVIEKIEKGEIPCNTSSKLCATAAG